MSFNAIRENKVPQKFPDVIAQRDLVYIVMDTYCLPLKNHSFYKIFTDNIKALIVYVLMRTPVLKYVSLQTTMAQMAHFFISVTIHNSEF